MSTAFLPLQRTVPPSLTTMSSLAPATEPERWTAKRSAEGVPQPARAARAITAAAVTRRIAATLVPDRKIHDRQVEQHRHDDERRDHGADPLEVPGHAGRARGEGARSERRARQDQWRSAEVSPA